MYSGVEARSLPYPAYTTLRTCRSSCRCS